MPVKTIRVACQGCGADLEVNEEVRFVTCNYCHARLEVFHDPTVTHTQVIEQLERRTGALEANLRVIELQNELEQLDREWKEKGGDKGPPSVIGNFLVPMAFGIALIAPPLMGFTNSDPKPISFLLGILAAALGVANGISAMMRQGEYQVAKATYEEKRQTCLELIDEARRDPPVSG